MPLNYPRSGYFLASYTLIQLVLILGRADFSRNQKTHYLRTWCISFTLWTEIFTSPYLEFFSFTKRLYSDMGYLGQGTFFFVQNLKSNFSRAKLPVACKKTGDLVNLPYKMGIFS